MVIQLMEIIFGTMAVTPEQCESVAVLYGRQLYKQTESRRAFAAALQAGADAYRVAWSQIANMMGE